MNNLPRHIAIIMDGNGRWAKQRGLSRTAGHKAGAQAIRKVLQACADRGIKILTLWAFSTENWQRPASEVNYLMELFRTNLAREAKHLHSNNVQFRVIGNKAELNPQLQITIEKVTSLTKNNTGAKLVLAINYSGRWDITHAVQRVAQDVEAGRVCAAEITDSHIKAYLSLADLPEPDLFIRTSGELRISNFFLWQLAYTELYFTDTFWPDFDEKALDQALLAYAQRERRFGLISEQVGK